jgi:hypothetical protein
MAGDGGGVVGTGEGGICVGAAEVAGMKAVGVKDGA